jgi:predicted GNAT superfamily acetyltransferase
MVFFGTEVGVRVDHSAKLTIWFRDRARNFFFGQQVVVVWGDSLNGVENDGEGWGDHW